MVLDTKLTLNTRRKRSALDVFWICSGETGPYWSRLPPDEHQTNTELVSTRRCPFPSSQSVGFQCLSVGRGSSSMADVDAKVMDADLGHVTEGSSEVAS
ncbi:unnamed protein product [Arctogadus glacialis]